MRDCGLVWLDGLFAQELRSHSKAVATSPVFGHSSCGSASYARLVSVLLKGLLRARVALPQLRSNKPTSKLLNPNRLTQYQYLLI